MGRPDNFVKWCLRRIVHILSTFLQYIHIQFVTTLTVSYNQETSGFYAHSVWFHTSGNLHLPL